MTQTCTFLFLNPIIPFPLPALPSNMFPALILESVAFAFGYINAYQVGRPNGSTRQEEVGTQNWAWGGRGLSAYLYWRRAWSAVASANSRAGEGGRAGTVTWGWAELCNFESHAGLLVFNKTGSGEFKNVIIYISCNYLANHLYIKQVFQWHLLYTRHYYTIT